MSDTPDWTGDRMRAVAREGRDATWDATPTSIAGDPRRRQPGAPVAPRRRLALRTAAGLGAIGDGWRQLLRRPGPAVRRVAVGAFVAVLLGGAVAGVLVSHGTAPPAQHSLVGGPISTTTTAATTLPGRPTTSVAHATTTTTVRSRQATTTGTTGNATTTTVQTATTTTTTPPAALAGYQQVDATASSTCSLGGPDTSTPCPGTGPTASATALCPSGDDVLGGGGSTSLILAQPDYQTATPVASLSASNPTTADNGWTATGVAELNGYGTTYTITVQSYAICAQVP